GAHLLAEPGHDLVGDRERRLGRDVARRRAGAAGGEHQVAALLVDQLLQRRLDHALLVGDEARLVAPGGRADRADQPLLQRRDAFVLVHAGGGAVADGDEADDELAHWISKISRWTELFLRAPVPTQISRFSHA